MTDVLPILTNVWSLLFRDVTNIEDLRLDGIKRVTKMAIRANTEPNKNGGPGSKCF